MTIVGERPESGVRIDVERPVGGGDPWRYVGVAVTPGDRFAVEASVAADGAVVVTLRERDEERAPAGLADAIRRLVAAAARHARTNDDAPPPRRIVRWRPEP